ncbi:delta-aminolevulinic acid dehydratase [Flagellimonas sp. CMM7]|uniref:delta-aminolevulinic acid dehydratase n=1 Tax=Flagellimonas sp. CMM7 TaxID=2654676 RepID=UPI001F183D43|nr:delta-aminolevulinic acid dehydratase [Flagellimonas sp. CMM7]UII81563.1 delta-aminolevulinic acid dehydratase [Flagellimonas sp. CMM7]
MFNTMPGIISKRKWPRIFITQLLKHSPLNFRKILGVEKGLNPKGIALFLTGYCNLYKISQDEILKEKITYLANKLIELQTTGYSGSCWGYNFPWQSRAFYQERYSPTVVVSCFAAYALLDAYEIVGDDNFLKIGLSSKDFVLNDLNRKYDEKGLIFSYSPFDNTEIINASLLGAKVLSRCYSYTGDKALIEIAKQAVLYASNLQEKDGSWPYGQLHYQNWVDSFHTGFNLEAIYDYQKYSGDNSFSSCIEKGLSYYMKNFIMDDGTPKYYHDEKYPIDIHCPAQYISTLITLEKNDPSIKKTLVWTLENMQGKKGYFYFQKKKFFKIKTPYMRWTQAWAFYAISKYLWLYGTSNRITFTE